MGSVQLERSSQGLHRFAPIAGQQMDPGQVDVVLGLVELDLDGVLAKGETFLDPTFVAGNSVAKIGIELAVELRALTVGLGDLAEDGQALFPLAFLARLDAAVSRPDSAR